MTLNRRHKPYLNWIRIRIRIRNRLFDRYAWNTFANKIAQYHQTHTHVNRSWNMESPQCQRRSKVANPTAPSSTAAPPAVIKQLRAPPATTKAAKSATAPLSGHGQVVSFTSLKLCNRLSYIFTCNVFSVDDLGTEEQRAARVPSRRHRRHRRQ